MTKTKIQRQIWWTKSLSDEQRAMYIEMKQAQKAKKRKNNPPDVSWMDNPKYPWYKTGVNRSNRKRWLKMINKKNPWLEQDFS